MKSSDYSSNQLWLIRLLKIALVLALLTVLVSSYIRLVESGVGCDDWPTCYGQYHYNESAQGVNVLMSQGENSPFRTARISHRLITSLLGLLVLTFFILSLTKKYRPLLGRKIPTVLLIITITLASIGQIHLAQPLPILIWSNFFGGLFLLAMLYLLYLHVLKKEKNKLETRFSVGLKAGLLLLVLQILWGGWTSANYAGSSCDTLLKCNAIIQTDLAQNVEEKTRSLIHFEQLELNQNSQVIFSSNMETIQLLHHIFAILSLIFFIVLSMYVEKPIHKYCMIINKLLVIQIFIGVSALFFYLPIVLVLAHNLLAALMVMLITSINAKLPLRASL